MKHTLTLFLCLLISASGFAKNTAATRQRLIAVAQYNDTSSGFSGCCPLLKYDSVALKYSGTNHSQFDYNTLSFFDMDNYSPVAQISSIIAPNNIDSSLYSQPTRFDTLQYFTYQIYNGRLSELLQFTEAIDYYPDGSPRQALHWQDSSSLLRYSYLYFYKDLVRVNTSTKIFGEVEKPESVRYLIRDAFGNVVIDSMAPYPYHGQPHYDVTTYEYDNAGRYTSKITHIAGAIFNDAVPHRYDYSSEGKVRRLTTGYDMQSGGFRAKLIDSFGYTPGVLGYTSREQYGINLSGPNYYYFKYTSHVNAKGLKDTAYMIVYSNAYLRTIKTTVQYNDNGNPTTITRTFYDETGKRLAYQKRYYYYEDYDPSLSIENTAKAPAITLSPNPTTGAITLHPLPDQRLKVTITNPSGQVVHAKSFFPQGGSINLSLGADVAPGHYYITVSGEDGPALYKGNFLKY